MSMRELAGRLPPPPVLLQKLPFFGDEGRKKRPAVTNYINQFALTMTQQNADIRPRQPSSFASSP